MKQNYSFPSVLALLSMLLIAIGGPAYTQNQFRALAFSGKGRSIKAYSLSGTKWTIFASTSSGSSSSAALYAPASRQNHGIVAAASRANSSGTYAAAALGFVTIVNKKFMVNGCPLYFNGANTPWESWNDFGGSYNATKWAQDMVDLKNKGINSTRIWFSCNGAGQPAIASDGTVSAPTAAFWSNCDHLFQQAQANGIYVMATMMSFDHTKNGNPNTNNWRAMMNDPAKIKTYIDNYLVPFVNRYKTNPSLWCIDLCNEIEWIYENGGGRGDNSNWGASYAVLQRFIGQCAAGLHQSAVARADGSKVLVTLGSSSVKWNGTKLPNGSSNPDGNKWSDANLQAQSGNDANAYLDFYSPHFYGWMEQYYSSPFEKTPAQYGMDDKACVVAEMPSRDPMPTPAMSLTTAFNNLKNGGWQGHMPWTANITTNLTTEVGSLADFGAAAQTFANNNSALVSGTCSSTCTTAAPAVTSPVTYCQGETAAALTASGTSLKWYTVATGGTASASVPTPSTAAAGTTNYYVSQALNGCEGPRATIAVTVNAAPAAPSVTSPVVYCQGATAAALTASGTSLKWYTVATGGTASSTSPVPSTAAAGTTNYYVSQTVNSCEGPRATIAVTVNATPAPPSVTSLVAYCQGATAAALTATGTSLKWYTAAIGGTASATAPTPSTAAAGTANYYVSQTVNNCEGPRSTIAVTVNATPAPPLVTSPVTYCQGETAAALTASGTSLKWYTAATGGTASATAPTPSTAVAGTTNYYVSQTVNSCEGPRATIAVTVNATPVAPSVTSPVTYCQGAVATTLTATGASLRWYTSATGGMALSTAPTPSTTASGTSNYYVSQTLNGCEGSRAAVAVTVNATPPAPGVTSPVIYCQNANAVALTADGAGLKWYMVQTGGSALPAAPMPVTASAGTTGYYVSQTINGCEGSRAAIDVTVNALPAATVTALGNTAFCEGGNVMLSANTGTGLAYLWKNNELAIAGATTSQITVTNSGSYKVEVTSNNCTTVSTSVTITVDVPVAAHAGNDQNITSSSTVLGANAPAPGGGIWSLTGGSGVFADIHDPHSTVSGLSAGDNTFTWTITNGACTSSDNVTIHVGTAPLSQTITGPDSVGYGTSGVIFSIPSNPGSTYSWTVPDGATIAGSNTGSSIVVDFGTSGGTGTVSVTEMNNYGSAVSTKNITAGPAPSVSSISGDDLVTLGQTHTYTVAADPNSNTVYHWTVPAGGTITSGQGTNTIMVIFAPGTESGNVTVTESNGFGNGTASLPVAVTAGTGLFASSAPSASNALVYPNPFQDAVSIIFNTSSTMSMALKVVDMKGTVVYESQEYRTNEKITLEINRPAGIYYVIAVYDNGSGMVKIEKY